MARMGGDQMAAVIAFTALAEAHEADKAWRAAVALGADADQIEALEQEANRTRVQADEHLMKLNEVNS